MIYFSISSFVACVFLLVKYTTKKQNIIITVKKVTYPSRELIKQDIMEDCCYVCEAQGEAVGVFYYREGNDPTYRSIYEGEWINDAPYAVIHRIAVATHCRGVASFCFSHCFARCPNIRIDTHRQNLPMQRSLAKNGFSRCGIIYLEDGSERIAYQKV